MARNFSVKTVFEAVDKITGPVRDIERRIDRFIRNSSRRLNTLNNSLNRVTNRTKQMAVVGGAALAGTTAALAKLGHTGATFEDTLVSAATKFPGLVRRGTETYTRLEEVAKRMGRTTEFSASQAANGLNFLAMAGFNAQQSISALPGVIDLATVSQLGLGEASDIATDTLGSFNLMTEDTIQLQKNLTRVNDTLARTVTTSNTSVEQFFEAMKQSGAAAAGAGADIETYASGVGILAQSGIKASQAGTTLKRMFLQLAAPTGEAARTLKFLNVNVAEMVDGKRNMRDIIDVFEDIEKAIAPLGDADRAQALRNIFGLIPIAGVNAILNRGVDVWRDYREVVRDNEGASKQMASTMRNTVMKHFIALTSAAEGLQIALFMLERDTIDNFVVSTTKWVRALVEVIDANQELSRKTLRDLISTIKNVGVALITFIGVVIALKTVLLVLQVVFVALRLTMIAVNAVVVLSTGLWKVLAFVWASSVVTAARTLVTVLGGALITVLRTIAVGVIRNTLIPALTALWAVMVANPIGAIITVISALVAAGVFLVTHWDEVKEKARSIWEAIKGHVAGPIDWIQNKFGKMVSFMTDKIEFLKKWAKRLGIPFAEAKKSIEDLSAGVGDIASKVKMTIDTSEMQSILTNRGLGLSLNNVGPSPALGGGGLRLSDAESFARMISPSDRTEAATRSGMSDSMLELRLRAEPGTSASLSDNSGPLKPKVKIDNSGSF